jgi:uncharacterized repeat protein (TIGR03806 family)
MHRCFTLALFVFGGLLSGAFADEKADEKKLELKTSYECRFTDDDIKIDGKADEKAWQQAELIDQFTLPWLREKNRPARTATKARLLWDREHLYFFAEMDDGDLYANVKENDGLLWNNDVFELFFKPADDKPGYYEFQVNAANAVLDMLLPRRGAGGYDRFIKDGDFHIQSKVELRGTLNNWSDKDRGWSVEGRIPWADFLKTGGRPAVDEKWKFALCRYDYSIDFEDPEGPELSTCAPLNTNPFPNFHAWEGYATLTFVGPDRKNAARPFGVEKRIPLMTSRVVGTPEPPPPYVHQREWPKFSPAFPVFLINEPGSGRMLFIDQPYPYGRTRVCRTKDDPATGEFDVLLEHDGTAYTICFHPKFAENGFMYLGWNGPSEGDNKWTRITRYTLARKAPFGIVPDSAKLIIEWPSNGHNGGAMTFGLDGMLYITSGDGTSDSDTNLKGQGLDHLLAKVLRIDVDHPEGERPYSVPKDNPFVGQKDAVPETYAYGFRNPWRIATDPKTGHIWVGNNGQDLWEQVYFLERGANYGWSVYEGSHPFYLNRKLGPTPVSKPAAEHHHSESRSLTGGIVYYGKKLPELRGAYIYGDHSTGKVWAIKHDGKRVTWHREIADTPLHITVFALDADGELLLADHAKLGEGGFYRLVPRPADQAGHEFPRMLSASGLFKSVAGHKVQPALIPYSVNSPLWSDGAHKERFIGLVGENPKIDFHPTAAWGFADGTVLVKSFALEMVEGDPASRKWIETRFLTRQQGEWVGYSYAWNDEQTDGMLVENEGADREFVIHSGNTQRKQSWHFPSRTECMVCHSRAANFVLGLTGTQMNRDHDYGEVVDNQLRTLEHLNVFKVDWRRDVTSEMRQALITAGKTEKEADAEMHRITATRNQREAPYSSLLAKRPPEYQRLTDPYDSKADLTARAKSYLHVNCSICHVEAGGGNAQMELGNLTPLAKMRLLDTKPMHHTFDLRDAKLIAPGEPDRSVLLHRVALRGQGQMPPMSTSVVDEPAVTMLREWIASLKPLKEEPKK